MSGMSAESLARAEQVLDSVRDEWLKRPGVTAVDLGYKWKAGQMTDLLAIRVHVAEKKREETLSSLALFPKEVDGIPVDVIEASYSPQTSIESKIEQAVEGRGRRFDIIPVGVSVGSKFTTAGTLGAKVIDRESGEEMILSNWHVLAGRKDAQEGLSIWQPGWIDGGTSETNTIAHLSRWVLGPYDAAVARLNGEREVKSTSLEGRPIEEFTQVRLGMQVWKSGRSTGLTEGFVDGIKMTVPLSYGGNVGVRLMEQVFRIVPRPGVGDIEISIGGDSGSVWVDEESGKAVGLHFAGEVRNNPEHALAHDIGVVVERLNVRFLGERLPVAEPPSQPSNGSRPPGDRPLPANSFWISLSTLLRRLLRTADQ